MGSKRVGTSDRSKDLTPAGRAYVEQSRKRFQCDLLAFWQRCKRPGCRQHHRCVGNPRDCFSRHHAAMPGDYPYWPVVSFFSKTTGIKTIERELRAAGVSLQGRLRVQHRSVPPPAVPPQQSEASRQARGQAEVVARVAPRGIASLERDLDKLGTTVARKIDWKSAGAAQHSLHDRGTSPDVDEPDEVEWSPMIGSSVDPVRAARLPSQHHAGSAPATPAALAEADADTARPPAATRPPGVEPWQAWCDDEGRLHMPDPAAVNERFRMLTAAEIHERMRSYGSSAERS